MFIPRKLAKRSQKCAKSTFCPAPILISEPSQSVLDENACLVLLSLALSDRELSRNSVDSDGWLPLTRVIAAAPKQFPSESILVQLSRRSGKFDTRLRVSRSVDDDGGFEVRRKDWHILKDRLRNYTTAYWDYRTVYLENIPASARTIPQVYQFLVNLLQPTSSDDFIQSISFPLHHADPPSSPLPSKSKGFAFLVFSDIAHTETFTKHWPWTVSHLKTSSLTEHAELQSDHEKAIREAKISHLRCMALTTWNKLAEEYHARQKDLVHLTANSNNSNAPFLRTVRVRTSTPGLLLTPENDSDDLQSTNRFSEHSAYPPGCLLFVQHILPDTNKTTLKSFFASAFDSGRRRGGEIDYVDFSKGLDSCYLRLSSPKAARTLIDHFTTQKLSQKDALDAVPFPTDDDAHAHTVTLQLVQGTREALYWEKVPEKIRKAAVLKVLNVNKSDGLKEHADVEMGNNGDAGRRKKRRRFVL